MTSINIVKVRRIADTPGGYMGDGYRGEFIMVNNGLEYRGATHPYNKIPVDSHWSADYTQGPDLSVSGRGPVPGPPMASVPRDDDEMSARLWERHIMANGGLRHNSAYDSCDKNLVSNPYLHTKESVGISIFDSFF